jgi:hypothetical protein
MAKKIYAELDRITFDSIKRCRTANGMIDENKFFKGLKEGDSVVFSCNRRKIEAVLKKIKKYNSISEYLKMNSHIGMMELNSSKPMDILGKITDKKVRIYEVDYYPYGDNNDNDGDGNGSEVGGGNRLNNSINSGNKEIDNFISALFGGNIDNFCDDE